jgi:hypothetical protein
MITPESLPFIRLRLKHSQRALQLLKETIDRNLPPNEPVDAAVANCELELRLLERVLES